jgi:hypothetical protein
MMPARRASGCAARKFIESLLPASGNGQKYELVMDFQTNTLHRIPL